MYFSRYCGKRTLKLLYSRKGCTSSGLISSIFQWSMSSVSQGLSLRQFFLTLPSGLAVAASSGLPSVVDIIIIQKPPICSRQTERDQFREMILMGWALAGLAKQLRLPTLSFFIMEQEANQQQSSWVQSLTSYLKFTADTIDFLEAYHSRAIKKVGLYRYPLQAYIRTWKTLNAMLSSRIQTFIKSGKLQAIVSTAIFWALPSWATSYNDIYLFIRRYNDGQEGEEIDQALLKEVYDDLKLVETYGLQEVKVDFMLKLPFYFLEKLMENGLELALTLDERIFHLKSQLTTSSTIASHRLINILQIQSKQLQLSLKQLNMALQFLNKEDSTSMSVNRDNSVLRYNFIMKQFDPIEKGKKKLLMRYIYRIKLICRWNKLQKKRVERLKERKMNILQVIDGQEKYIKGLIQYITNIKDPIEKLGVLTENQLRKLFSSIVEIKNFHEAMYASLKAEYNNYSNQQLYAPILKKFIPFFKLYTDYILNAESAQRFLQELIKTNKEIGEICKTYTANTNKVAENELLQPTFRIARYEMLFQQIIKKTSQSHKDYLQFIDVNANFKKILTQVNDEVDKIIRRTRMNQLQQEFSTPEFPIFKEKREFLNQYSLTLIKEPKPQSVSLIVFNDLLLIVEESTRKLQRRIPVTDDFFVRRQEDNKIYRNMITIHSDGFTTFTTGSDEVFAKKAEEVYEQLKKITKETSQLVFISVLGTEEIGSTSFKKYTEYIVEVKYLDLKKLLHLRFSTISNIVADMQRYYKDSLKITEEESLSKNWLNSHKSKIIEARKLIIGQIFQKLFNHQLIKRDPAYFLKALNFPQNFYKIARSSYEKRFTLGQNVAISGLKSSFLTKKQQKQAFTILCGTQIKLGRDLFHDNDNDEQLKKKKDLAEKIDINVQTLFQDDPIVITITEYDTVEDVCNKVSKLIGLRSNRDFRLFHQIGKKELRVLEHEQLMTKIFQFPRKNENLSISNRFFSFAKSFYCETPTLIFKKYYYLPFQIQQAQVRKDLTRLRLIVYQVFSEIKDMKYQLTFDEYILFLAMHFYINAEGKPQNITEEDVDLVHKVIPDTVFKLKNYSEKEWFERCRHHLKRIHEQIQKVIEYNRDQLKHNRIKAETVSKQSLYFGHKHLCSQIVLNKIKTNPIFGSNLFYVQPHNNCYKKLEERGMKVAYNMWLAVKVESVDLLTPSSKESILQLKYQDIGKVEVFSQSIVFKTLGAFQQEYRLNTYQSFQISQLVKYNQALNEILVNLKNDSGLSSRVKQYRDQLMQYRTTYEDDPSQISLIR